MDRSGNIQPLHQDTVVPPGPAELLERVADRLREEIISGTLARGQRLDRRALAEQFGAPLDTVCAALRQVNREGYVRQSGRMTVVMPLRLGARELLLRRRRVELALTRSAARLITPFGLRRLERLSQEMTEAQLRQDLIVVQRCNYRFHTWLYRYANRPDLLGEMHALWAGFPFDLMTTMPDRMAAVAEEHAAVLWALRRNDPIGAGRAMQVHIQQGWQEFQRHYPLQPAPSWGRAVG